MNSGKQSRNPAMDIIRCFALFCVVAVHFFLNSGFYNVNVSGGRMYVMMLLRTFFMICVPLFMVLSGYLMKDKRPEGSYYKKIGKTLAVYLLACIACAGYDMLFHRDTFSLKEAVLGIPAYSTAPYAWYIEMYIGLFVLIPFLNVLYNNLESRRQKQYLLLTMLFLTSAPSMANIFRIDGLQWWLHPASSREYQKLLPNWWESLYPITYYFIGCYLREYPLKLRRFTNLILIVLVFFLAGTFSYYRCHDSLFIWGQWQDWGSVFNTVQTVLVFHFLSQLRCDRIGPKMRAVLARLSDWCLGGYLVSWIFDDAFYPILDAREGAVHYRLRYFPLIVPAVYICSLALSGVLTECYNLVAKRAKRQEPIR